MKNKSKSTHKYTLSLNSLYPKTRNKTSQILTYKLLDQLKSFQDDQKISLLTSIPILHAGSIIQVIKSIQEVQQLLSDNWKSHETRLRNQAKFIYHLWKVIAEEEIPMVKMKEIIYLFHEKKGLELKAILSQMFGESDDLDKLYKIWTNLNVDMIYYRECNKKKHQREESTTKINELQNSIQKQKFNLTTNFSVMAAKSKERTKYKSKASKQKLNTQYETSEFIQDEKVDSKCDTQVTKKKNSKRIRTEYDQQKENEPFLRLYDKQFYQKRMIMKEQIIQKQKEQEMKECTFQPKLYESRSRSNKTIRSQNSLNKTVKGFDKSINRMKDGYLKEMEKKKKMNYINVGQNYDKIKEKRINPPKFLQRKKKQQEILLSIGFEINNKKTVVKIRERDTAQSAAIKICQIYGLNPKKYQQEIQEIIQSEIQNYTQQSRAQ